MCEQHGRDESVYATTPPEAVVFCTRTEEVAAVVTLAAEHGVPVIPFGVGSSLEGHLLAVQGGVSIDLGRIGPVTRPQHLLGDRIQRLKGFALPVLPGACDIQRAHYFDSRGVTGWADNATART